VTIRYVDKVDSLVLAMPIGINEVDRHWYRSLA
jgi:hypothetical protein